MLRAIERHGGGGRLRARTRNSASVSGGQPRRGLQRQQQPLEALGPAQRVRCLEQVEQRRRHPVLDCRRHARLQPRAQQRELADSALGTRRRSHRTRSSLAGCGRRQQRREAHAAHRRAASRRVCSAWRAAASQRSSRQHTASAPQSCSVSKKPPAIGSPSARSISRQTRSGTSASTRHCSTMRRISARVSGATVNPSARSAPRNARRAARAPDPRRRPARRGAAAGAPDPRGRRTGSISVPSARARHRIDGQVAPLQVLLERDLRRELGGEAAIAGRGLALQPRQRVLLVRLGMQETGNSRPTARYPSCSICSGVAPTTTQSRSLTGRPSNSSRTAPPTR